MLVLPIKKKWFDLIKAREKIEELDMRYRLALALLVFRTGEHIDTFIETIDKTIGHKYWNFIGSDK